MALFHPSEPPAAAPASELAVRKALTGLDNGWHVFHSVAWQGKRKGRQADGEADFVLLHASYGMVVLEVKGGGIAIEDGRWSSTNQDGTYEIKDPFQQAVDNKHALVGKLQEIKGLERVWVEHAVALPDATVSGALGPNAPREITIDRDDLQAISTAIERVVKYWELSASLGKGTLSASSPC